MSKQKIQQPFAARLAANLKELCERDGINAVGLSQKLKLAATGGYRLLKGNSPSAAGTHIDALAALFGVPLDFFMRPYKDVADVGTVSKAKRTDSNRGKRGNHAGRQSRRAGSNRN